MTKTEYLNQLQKYLKRLPKADYENAMEHFTEYFEEAGPEKEERVMQELGTPREAAADLLKNLLDRDLNPLVETEGGKTFLDGREKERHSAGGTVLIACLAVMAAPIAAPLAFAAVVLLLAVVLVLLCCILAVFLFGVSGVAVGVKLLLRGIVALPYSISGAGMIIGTGMIGIGGSMLLFALTFILCAGTGKMIALLIQWIISKSAKKKVME